MKTPAQHTARRIAATALQQIALAAVVFLLLAGWLHIPDANAFEVMASVVTALLIFGVIGAGETAIALRLTGRPVAVRRLLLGTGVLFVALLGWYAISIVLQHLGTQNGLRAGYYNSKLPAGMRHVFSYEHLYLWLDWLWRGLGWIAGGLLGAAAFACATCDRRLRGLASILRSGRYWLSLLLLTIVGGIVFGTLLNWTPGHGLAVEFFSLVVRVLTVILAEALVVALLFHAMAAGVLRVQDAGKPAPDSNQPRTADVP